MRKYVGELWNGEIVSLLPIEAMMWSDSVIKEIGEIVEKVS